MRWLGYLSLLYIRFLLVVYRKLNSISLTGKVENTMSAATDALNKAIDDLGSASHAMLDKISADAEAINKALAGDDTPEVDAATARIADMAAQLKSKLGALSDTAAASASGAGDASINAGGVPNPLAAVGLAGVPETPASAAPLTAAAVPGTDNVVTETSPNQETSGPTTAPGQDSVAAQQTPPAAEGPADVNPDVKFENAASPATGDGSTAGTPTDPTDTTPTTSSSRKSK